MKIDTLQYLDEKGILSEHHPSISASCLLQMYTTMLTSRYIDERMLVLHKQGMVTFVMSARGEEACAVASAAALNHIDWMYPQYREAGIMFWRGLSIQQYIDHMFCNSQDNLCGRQLSNHFGSQKLNVVPVSCPIATQIPHAAGCAYAMKLQREPAIAICYFGEGATSEGDFHTGMNFAAVRKVPAIFFCRNNGYAISTPCSSQFASDGVAPKGIGYGVTTYRVDGNDVFAIYQATAKARNTCLEGKGPVLIEAMTYRLGSHSTADDSLLYRSPEEVAEKEKKCPILRLRTYLQNENLWNQCQEDQFKEKIKREVDEAIATAKAAPPPTMNSLFEDVYFEMTPNLQEQYEFLMQFNHGTRMLSCPK